MEVPVSDVRRTPDPQPLPRFIVTYATASPIASQHSQLAIHAQQQSQAVGPSVTLLLAHHSSEQQQQAFGP